ncbi:MAG: hypothetical protein MHM6MM_008816 [Cercozoa sp. M6MM]
MSTPMLRQVTKNVMAVTAFNPGPMTLQGTNTYLLGSGSHRVLVDTGAGVQRWRNVLAFLAQGNLEGAYEECRDYDDTVHTELQKHEFLSNVPTIPFTVSDILLTHAHPDHISGLTHAKELFPQARVWKLPPVDPDMEVLPMGEMRCNNDVTVTALATPGHCADHSAFVFDNTLFVGDTILSGTLGTSVADLRQYLNTLDVLREHAKRCTVLASAHGLEVHGTEEMLSVIDAYKQHRIQRVEQVEQVLRDRPSLALTAKEIASEIYVDIEPHLLGAATSNVRGALDYLRSKLRVSDHGDGTWQFVDH